MAQLTVKQYDILENAVVKGSRILLRRRGTDYLVIPIRVRVASGREAIDARHPSTGHAMSLWIDELDSLEAVV